MSFLSFSFAAFLLGTVASYWLLPERFRKGFLLGASLLFYASAFPPHAALIVCLMLVVYGAARLSGPGTGRGIFVLTLTLCVLVLAYFKYARLLVSTVADLGGPTIGMPDVRIPLGISFFTFEFVHFLVDVRFGRIVLSNAEGRRSLLDFSLFTLFFPALLSGPIKRYQNFVSEGNLHTRFSSVYLAEGLSRIVIGLAKKIVIADSMTEFSARLLTPDQVTGVGLWVAMYAYAVKIYFDFSGYSDLAIGAARLFGYRLPENFDNPYLRRNLSEFWRHWHMSLSSWIRDYLFIPLGGSHRPPVRVAINLTVVMAICGLWHGASWNFVVWGLWHGVGLALLRVWQRVVGPVHGGFWGQVASTFLTFQYVCLGWVLFAAPTLGSALTTFERMFTLAR